MAQPSGFLLIDKPLGWTSHDVVAKLRVITGIRKIGHGGALDPLATGLLVTGIGKATKLLDEFVQGDKTYLATIRLGSASTTDDAEGELTAFVPKDSPQAPSPQAPTLPKPDRKEVANVLASFDGKQRQIPPSYAALKVGGQKYYQLARQGLPVPRQSREVVFYAMDLLEYAWPDITLRTNVGKGTYIRALARDVGEKLGTGGYLASLRREKVGHLDVKDAATIDEIKRGWQDYLLPV